MIYVVFRQHTLALPNTAHKLQTAAAVELHKIKYNDINVSLMNLSWKQCVLSKTLSERAKRPGHNQPIFLMSE